MATATVPSPPSSSRELGSDEADMFYYEEETVFDEEETIVLEEESVAAEDFPLASSQRGLRTLHEDNIMEEEEEECQEDDEIIETLEVLQEYEEEILEEPIMVVVEEELEMDEEDADDESSAWVDDGRDYTKDPNIFAGKTFHVSDHFASEEAGEEEEPFYLDVPDIEDVSSLEDNFSVVEGSVTKDSSQKFNLSVTSSQRKLNASTDWEELLSEDEEQKENQGEPSQPLSPPHETHTAHLRRTLSIKLEREQTPLFYGRTAELETLRQALEGIHDTANPRRLAWIYGKSGIGKTTLVESFLKTHVFEKDGILVGHGSFDERCAQAQKPYSALVDCFMQIVEQLIEDPVQPENSWRNRIREGIGKEARLLVLLVPNIAELVDIEHDETDVETETFELSTGRLLERLRFVLRRFLRIICSHRKLVVFLDELQCADEDSLRMIDTLLSTHALKNFFFIGCHRGVKQTHLLGRIKSKLSALSAANIMMKPVDKEVTNHIVLHHLKDISSSIDDAQSVEELSTWITEKSGGDACHINQLVRFLMEEGKIRRDGNGKWSWDFSELKDDKSIPSNALDLVSERIKKLSLEVKLILKSASFLGLRDCEIQALKNVIPICFVKKMDEECPITDETEIERYMDVASDAGLMQLLSPGFYGFTHETVRKAATLLLPKSPLKHSALHFTFATKLKSELSALPNTPHVKEEVLRSVADHLTLATENVKDTQGKEDLARIHLDLAEASMRHASFSSAIRQLHASLALLDEKTRWNQCYDLTLKLHLRLSRVYFCQGNLEKSKIEAEKIMANSKAPRDKLGAYELLIWISVTRNQLDEAITFISQALREIWNDEPSRDVEGEVAAIREVVKGKTDNDLLSLPEMTHKKIASKLCFLTRLAEISWMGQNYLNQDLAALKMIDMTLRYGTSKYASLSYTLYGVCLARRNLHKEAFRFGNLAAMIAQQDTPLGAQAITFYHYAIAYWKRQFQASLEPLQASAIAALESNDIEHLSFRVGAYLSHVLATGSSLTMGDSVFRRFKEYAIAFRGRETWLATIPFKLMLKLRGESIEPAERGFDKYTDSRAVQYGVFFQMIHAIFMQEVAIAEKLSNRLFLKPEGVWLPMRGFYEGLIATSSARASSGKIRIKHQRKAAKIIEVLGGWAKTGLKQVHHMANLINVELRILSDTAMPADVASSMYDVAIGAAAKAGFVQHEALTNERAGIMLHEQKQDELARKHLNRARELYRSWGAIAKVRDMEAKFPNYFLGAEAQSNTVLCEGPNHVGLADLSSVPSLDFGESQIIHFNVPQSMPKAPDDVGGKQGSHLTEGIVRRESRAGSGPPPVRVPVVGGNRRVRTSSRTKASKGARLGTPGRAPTLPKQVSSQEYASESTRHPETATRSEVKSGEVPRELDFLKPESINPREKQKSPTSFDRAKPIEHFSKSSSSLEMQTESDLSDDDLRSVQSDVGAQSDFGPRYEGEKRQKEKKKLRRKLKPSSKKVSDDTDGRRLVRSHSLSSGLDAHSDSEVPQKQKRRVVSTKKKKESSLLKRIPKGSMGAQSDDQQDSLPVLDSDVTRTGTIKMKSKAKAEEEKEINPKKEPKVRRSASVDRSTKKKGSGSKKDLLDEIRTKGPRRSRSKLVPADTDHGKQKSRSKDELLIEIKASGGNVSARKTKKKTSDSMSSRITGNDSIISSETKNDDEGMQPIRALTRNLSWSGKRKKESKHVEDDTRTSATFDLRIPAGTVPTKAPVRGLVKSLSWSGKRKDNSIKQDQGEIESVVDVSSEQTTTTPSTSRGIVRSLSWNGKRKKRTKEDEEFLGTVVRKSFTAPATEWEVSKNLTAPATDREVRKGSTSAADREVSKSFTAPATDREVEKGSATSATDGEVSKSYTAPATDREVEKDSTTSATDREVSTSINAPATDREVKKGSATSATDREVKKGSATSATDREVSKSFTAPATDREVKKGSNKSAAGREVSKSFAASATDREVRKGSTTSVTDRELSKSFTAPATDREVRKGSTTSAIDREVSKSFTAPSTDREVRKGSTTSAKDREVSKTLTAPATDQEVGKSLTAHSTERKKTSKIKKEKKGDETIDAIQAPKAKKGIGLLVKVKRTTKKTSNDSTGG